MSKYFLFSILFLMFCADFQDESYTINPTDKKAILAISDTFLVEISTVKIDKYDTTWTHSNLAINASALYDSIQMNSISFSLNDTAFFVKLAGPDTSYATFFGSSGTITIYVSEHTDIQIIDKQGITHLFTDNSIDAESANAAFYGPEGKHYYLKTRYEFRGIPENVLFKFIKLDQAESTKFNLFISN